MDIFVIRRCFIRFGAAVTAEASAVSSAAEQACRWLG